MKIILDFNELALLMGKEGVIPNTTKQITIDLTVQELSELAYSSSDISSLFDKLYNGYVDSNKNKDTEVISAFPTFKSYSKNDDKYILNEDIIAELMQFDIMIVLATKDSYEQSQIDKYSDKAKLSVYGRVRINDRKFKFYRSNTGYCCTEVLDIKKHVGTEQEMICRTFIAKTDMSRFVSELRSIK